MDRKKGISLNTILLDLDGTITNPKEGITKSIQYALRKVGIEVEDLDTLTKHIGPPLKEGFMEMWGFDEETANRLVTYYREYFSVTGIYENVVYDGMEELLKKLKAAGKTLIVATSKPEFFAKQIMEHFHLDLYVTDICGSNLDGTRTKKGDVIAYAMKKNHITHKEDIIMVGDRSHDIIGAKENGIPCVGVLYGFGNEEEFRSNHADYIVKDVDELGKILMETAS